MFNKGEVTVGLLLTAFIAVIFGVALLLPIAGNVEALRNTINVNTTITTPAINATIEIPGSGIIGTPEVINTTDGATIPAGNFTILGRQAPITGGIVTNTYTSTAESTVIGVIVNLSYTAEPDGFDTSPGGRAIIGLIIIFAAIAIAIVAIVPAARSGVFEMMGR